VGEKKKVWLQIVGKKKKMTMAVHERSNGKLKKQGGGHAKGDTSKTH